jgi:hypothetical protein
VFVARHCYACGEARRLAQEASARFPHLEVRVVNLEDGAPAPELLVAVPTYMLDGKVVWLGNPAPEELFTRLREGGA